MGKIVVLILVGAWLISIWAESSMSNRHSESAASVAAPALSPEKLAEYEAQRSEIMKREAEFDRRYAIAAARYRKLADDVFCLQLGVAARSKKARATEDYMFMNRYAKERMNAARHDLIEERRLDIGMAQCDVLAMFGRPERAHRSVNAYGTRDQWVYPGWDLYVYFSNGVVTSWQQ